MNTNETPRWECHDGEPDEDHDWVLVPGEADVGLDDCMRCRQCGKERAATEEEIAASYDDSDDYEFQERTDE